MRKILIIALLSTLTSNSFSQKYKKIKCPYLTIIGGTVINEGKPDLLNVLRGKQYKFLTYDFNQDGIGDNISYWLSRSLGHQKIISSFGDDLLEDEDLYKQEYSEIWALVVRPIKEKNPILILYYHGSNNEDPTESKIYFFRFKNGKFNLTYSQTLVNGIYPDALNFNSMVLEDSYGSQGLFNSHKIKI